MVWKKNEAEPVPVTPTPSAPRPRPETRHDVATIGPSISIKGDLSGQEDLLIQGRVEGNIQLKKNNVTVGHEGRVRADIHGRSIRVEGEVRGNLFGEEDVVIRESGVVSGNILAPRVTLENGSKFKGSIDMEPGAAAPAQNDAQQAASRKDGKGHSGGDKNKGGHKSSGKRSKSNGAPDATAESAVTVPPETAQAGLQLDKSGANR